MCYLILVFPFRRLSVKLQRNTFLPESTKKNQCTHCQTNVIHIIYLCFDWGRVSLSHLIPGIFRDFQYKLNENIFTSRYHLLRWCEWTCKLCNSFSDYFHNVVVVVAHFTIKLFTHEWHAHSFHSKWYLLLFDLFVALSLVFAEMFAEEKNGPFTMHNRTPMKR